MSENKYSKLGILIEELLNMRKEYILNNEKLTNISEVSYKKGIYIIKGDKIKTIKSYYNDLLYLQESIENGDLKSFSHDRFKLLLLNWDMYKQFNKSKEYQSQIRNRNDIYTVPIVDNHIHHSSSMNQKFLLDFIKKKIKNNSEDIVVKEGEKEIKLKNILDELNIKSEKDLNIDLMNVHAVGGKHCFRRFDKFNSKYNPCGLNLLRTLFLKTDNYMNGKYLAEMTKLMIKNLEKRGNQFVEWRLSIYGKEENEWYKLADWVCNNKLLSNYVKWYIQVPRLYYIYKEKRQIDNFSDMIYNIFNPIINSSINKCNNENLKIFLENIGGFDTVDDETKFDIDINNETIIEPEDWNSGKNPPYSYYMYYMYINICSVNKIRQQYIKNTFEFRPHCGEGGAYTHISSGYLLATKGISHGLKIMSNPVYKYLFYLSQIGISISPLSNNSLVLKYIDNPFPIMFKSGMNITLSTDDPLMFHYTMDPLMEEYSIASQIWHLSNTDMCELARNSVLQSGLSDYVISKFYKNNDKSSDLTNISSLRFKYREDNLKSEQEYIKNLSKMKINK